VIDYLVDTNTVDDQLDYILVLIIASKQGNLEMAKYAVEKGADYYHDAWDSAIDNGNQNIVDYLNGLPKYV